MRFYILFLTLFVGINAVAQTPRYNEVFWGATHNSYWVKRAAGHELFATGTQERLLDQLFLDHARALEIDIHKIHKRKGEWAVYHTTKSKNSFFATLPDFLKQLQQFHYSQPKHEVVTVIFELKQILGKNFDKTHTPADLDLILEEYFGKLIFKPSDLMKRCPHDTTLCDCADSSPDIWPTINELRGKFIFVVLGNLHVSIIGHGGAGWVTYANSPHPVAFPMSSDFSVFNDKKGRGEKVSADMLTRAYDASVFQQVENVNDTAHLAAIAKYISKGGVVRGASSFSIQEQEQRINAGFNMLQTDYPALQYRDKGFAQPFRPMDITRFPDTMAFQEPGHRIFLAAGDSFWTEESTTAINDWETLPSSTRKTRDQKYPDPYRPYGKGCLIAESKDGQNAISVCRQVDLRQNAVISVEVKQKNNTLGQKFITDDNTCGRVGDMIRLLLERDSTAQGMNVHVYSSSHTTSSADGDFKPVWNEIYNTRFEQILSRQGLAAHDGDVLFVGTKRNGVYVSK